MSRRTRQRRFLAALFLAYLVALTLIAFWPSPVDSGSAGSTLRSVLSWLHARGVPGWFNYNFVEFTANILLFVPFGFFLAAYLDRRWILAVPVAGLLVSCAIELGQLVFLPTRFATLSDLVANTLGTVVGAGFSLAYLLPQRTPSLEQSWLRL